ARDNYLDEYRFSATTTTANLSVTATVVNSCTVTAPTAIAFGPITASTTTNQTTAGVVSVDCTANQASVSVTLDGGANVSTGQRRMSDGGTNYMPYNLFSDASHTTSIAVGGTIYSGGITALTPQNISIYGQVPPGSYVAGSYTDTVLVTLTY
ncbi:hypothetical protein U879_08425, partial [Defluviimonas sp. 20V17]